MGESLGIRHLVVVVERLNLVKKEFAGFVNLKCHVLSSRKIPTVLQPYGVFLLYFSLRKEKEKQHLLAGSAATTTNACVVLKSRLIHCIHSSHSVFHPVSPSASFPVRSIC